MIVELWNSDGGIVEQRWRNSGTEGREEWSNDGGTVEQWNGGTMEQWNNDGGKVKQ